MQNRKILEPLLFFLSPFLGVILVELFVRKKPLPVLNWIFDHFFVFLLTVFIFLIVQILIISLINNLYLAILLSQTFFLLIALVNRYKLNILNDPLLPWDLFFMNQISDLLPVLYSNLNIIVSILSVVIIALLFYVTIKFSKFHVLSWRYRLILFLTSLIILMPLTNYKNVLDHLIAKSELVYIPWDQKGNQYQNGLIMGFILNMPSININEPAKYSKENVTKHISEIKNNEYETSDKQPNIVIVMSEAFWELSNLNLDYNGSSLNPTVDQHQIGTIISPAFGGGTANVEFEVLTGFTMNHLPGGSVPYQQYIAKSTPSLASVLENQGYNTTAIHTYYKYFWNRVEVYNHLGFDKFIGLDDLKNPNYYGDFYVDDSEINNLIVKELKNNKEPTFIYAVTMQNHGTYLDTRYNEDTLTITESFSEDSNQIINTYGTGIIHSDKMLQSLFVQITKLDEPTLIVFFGDHLPALGDVFTELGYVDDMGNQSLTEALKMKQTPLVVWNNYAKEIQPLDSISSSFLAPKIMEWAELESPIYYHFLNSIRQEIPGYTAAVKLTKDGALSIETPEKLRALEESYQMIQYDMMFGKEYSREKLFETSN